ncbi:JmjC domain-containing protein [Kineococcus glutinatus]|uniref:JmjC domain-containing protein n=1 Tax=Kineococcus glutinatus TaxID=1070872 RepID=UPI003CD0692D
METRELASLLWGSYLCLSSRPSASVFGHNVGAAFRAALEPHLRLPISTQVQDGQVAFASPAALYYPDSGQAADVYWRAGHTLILQSLHARLGALNSICAELQARSGLRLSCSAYIAPPQAMSFSLHTDAWDALIVQVSGDKIFECSVCADGLTAEGETRGPLESYALRSGDALLLPEGIPHRARTATGSVHLSFNFIRQLAAAP